jgi:putative peptidoglycan lipid II flippase
VSVPELDPNPKPKRSLVNIAGIVAAATLISKVFGLLRTVLLAAVFGAAPAYGAYQYASIVPSFFLILLGGINGPFHSAMVSVLAKKDRQTAAETVEAISSLVGVVMLVACVLVVVFAPQLLFLVASGLSQQQPEVREMAITQLRIMAPVAWFAGMIGIGFGALNAVDVYWLPSISPLLSSVVMVVAVGGLGLVLGNQVGEPQYGAIGGIVLAIAFVAGTVLQWFAQMVVQRQERLGRLRFRWDLKNPAVQDVMKVMGPALFASGMLQINVYTDMQFTSYLKNPAAAVSALDYANLLVQTPLGILSNMILVPLLPVFSKLADPLNWNELKGRIRQGILITGVAMLPLGALMMVLAKPIVSVVYERGRFDPDLTVLTASVLTAYAFGMFVYLSRDVLVRVFYALGDSTTPFRISLVNIGLNALFDYLLLPLGVPGLVLATVSVNILSVLALIVVLNRRLGGLPLLSWGLALLGLTGASVVAGLACWSMLQGLQGWLGNQGMILQLVELSIAGIIGLAVFVLLAMQLRLPEVNLFVNNIRSKVLKS